MDVAVSGTKRRNCKLVNMGFVIGLCYLFLLEGLITTTNKPCLCYSVVFSFFLSLMNIEHQDCRTVFPKQEAIEVFFIVQQMPVFNCSYRKIYFSTKSKGSHFLQYKTIMVQTVSINYAIYFQMFMKYHQKITSHCAIICENAQVMPILFHWDKSEIALP